MLEKSAACQEHVGAISGTPKSQSDRRRFQHRPRLQTFPGPPKRRRFAGPSSSSAAGGLHMDLDVAGGQEAAVRRESVTVITRRATKPDAEAVHAYTRFAVVLHIHAERVARSAVDRRRALKCRMLVIAQDADKCDRRALEIDVVRFVRIIQGALEAVGAIRLSVKAESQAVADLSVAGDLAGMTDDRGAGRHTGHAFVVNRRDDVEAADRALRGIGVTSRDGKLLGQATRSESCYAARRLCAVTPVDARCVMAGAGSGSRIGGIWLRSGRIGESGHRLRPSVGADVDRN